MRTTTYIGISACPPYRSDLGTLNLLPSPCQRLSDVIGLEEYGGNWIWSGAVI
jgi:hypothetical protein